MSFANPRFWRAILLGVVNALIYTGVLFIADKIVGYEGWPRVRWAWISTTVLFLVCFSLASYLVHRIWFRRISSIIWLWLGVGVLAVIGWNALWLSVAYWEKYTTNFTVVYREVTALNNPQFGLFSLALVVGTNLLFAGALKLGSRHGSASQLS